MMCSRLWWVMLPESGLWMESMPERDAELPNSQVARFRTFSGSNA